MGMDYTYAGSATYFRFGDEHNKVVKLFGAIESSHIVKRTESFQTVGDLNYRYKFPEGTPDAFYKWANEPFGYFNYEQTKTVYDFMQPKWEEVKEISFQIAQELEYCMEDHSYWNIC